MSRNVHSSWFRQRLENTYASIRATAPNAEVFILGYPALMGLPSETHCNWALHTMTTNEQTLVDDIGSTLNGVIEDEAAAAGFTFVSLTDVFDNHTPCSPSPFINGPNWLSHQEYSYHPNAAGANAIYEKLQTVM